MKPNDTDLDDELTPAPTRLASVDAYRGTVMFLLLAESLHLAEVAKLHPDVKFWEFLAHHQEHVEWVGCSLHDLIQPSFSFLVGVALPFSIASRLARGQNRLAITAHAFWRAFVLAALGIFLRSQSSSQTNFTFEDTLTQIGLGYGFLFLLGLRPVRDQWVAFVTILVGYWALFAWYTPGPDFAYSNSTVGVDPDWPHLATGFASHWNKNANAAWAFDKWFLNLFPRKTPFLYNGGGYSTLSFIPTLATMILGLIAGGKLRDEERTPGAKVGWLVVAGLVGLALGWGLGEAGVCPVVKKIWTPSWVLFSGGWCFLLLAAWYAFVDLAHMKPLAFPLIVIGMNSIAAYLITWTIEGWIGKNLNTHSGLVLNTPLGRWLATHLPPGYGVLIHGVFVVLTAWLILFWMYRRKIFLKV